MAETERFFLSDLLRSHQRGFTDIEAGNLLRNLIAEVDRTGLGGTLTIKVSCTSESRDEAVKIAFDLSTVMPKEKAAASLYFIDDDKRPTKRANQQPIAGAAGEHIFPPAESKD